MRSRVTSSPGLARHWASDESERWRGTGSQVQAHRRFLAREHELRGLTQRELYTETWRSNLWRADCSRSGLGSAEQATARLTTELPALLQAAPFNLPPPAALLNEGCREAEGSYDDKSLGVWRISDLAR